MRTYVGNLRSSARCNHLHYPGSRHQHGQEQHLQRGPEKPNEGTPYMGLTVGREAGRRSRGVRSGETRTVSLWKRYGHVRCWRA